MSLDRAKHSHARPISLDERPPPPLLQSGKMNHHQSLTTTPTSNELEPKTVASGLESDSDTGPLRMVVHHNHFVCWRKSILDHHQPHLLEAPPVWLSSRVSPNVLIVHNREPVIAPSEASDWPLVKRAPCKLGVCVNTELILARNVQTFADCVGSIRAPLKFAYGTRVYSFVCV